MKRAKGVFGAAMSTFMLVAATLSAQIPQLINYQGVLQDSSTGLPVDEDKSITFAIYATATGGTALWSETQTVSIDQGYFSVLLGSVTPIPPTVFSGGDRYLGVKVGTDAEMTPRKRIVSVGYALMAADADKVDGLDASAFAAASHNHDGRYYTRSQLNTSDGSPPNSGSNRISWNNLKDVPAGFADGTDDVGAGGGVTQINVGTGMTVTSPNGPTTTLGLRMGHGNGINADMVDGKHASSFAAASHDHFNAQWSGSGNGLIIKSTNDAAITGTGYWGIAGETTKSYSPGAYFSGVIGDAFSDAYGVCGRSRTGIGVYGLSDGIGVKGASSNKQGIFGHSNNKEGVYGESAGGISGYGVRGFCSGSNGTGVMGEANSGSSAYGIWGKSTGGFAGYFVGDVYVTGDFSVAGNKSFKIDHPLDPANEYLYHYCVESDERYNVYSGNAVLDANGEATVKLPQWFEALNKDFRYQLTCIGGFAQVYISDEIQNNTFKIAGGKPGMKISWQVTGVRSDAYAQQHPVKVEKEKLGRERGKYLHPELYGLPESMGMESIKSVGAETK
ncbi:hypothetical protein D6833_04845 [Candidatus Parcubacteria bacterium]|nr:MAG: hypothetical protein D6833_04845 [Candidatus Parcubacteria bacterium]